MKTFIPFTIAAALAASGFSQAQTAFSKPSGYVTKDLAVGFNLVSVTLQKPIIFTGVLSGVSGSVLTFSSDHGLPAGKTLILEVSTGSGASDSVVQEFATYGTNSITLPAAIPGLAQGDTVSVRDSTTLEEIFGDSLASQSGPATSDIVWVPSGAGQFDRYYRNTPVFGGSKIWKKLVTGSEVSAPNTPIIYLDGLFVEVKSAAKSITITGQVKTNAANFSIQTGFNLIGTIFPVGSTLNSSGLASQLKSESSPATSDIVWVPTGPGQFSRYYYNTPVFGGSPGWKTLTPVEGPVDGSVITLPESVFVERKGAAKNIKISPPASYTNL